MGSWSLNPASWVDNIAGTNITGKNKDGANILGFTGDVIKKGVLQPVDWALDIPLNLLGQDSNLSGLSPKQQEQLREADPLKYEQLANNEKAKEAREQYEEYRDEMGELFGWKRGEGFTKPTEMDASGLAMQEGARDQRARDLSSVKGRQAGRYGALSDRLMMSGADQGALERASRASERTSGLEEQQTMGQYSNLLNKIQSENIGSQIAAQRQFATGAGLQAPTYQSTLAEGGRQFDAQMKAKYDIANLQAQLAGQAGQQQGMADLGSILGMAGGYFLPGGGTALSTLLGGQIGSTLLGGGTAMGQKTPTYPTYDMGF